MAKKVWTYGDENKERALRDAKELQKKGYRTRITHKGVRPTKAALWMYKHLPQPETMKAPRTVWYWVLYAWK